MMRWFLCSLLVVATASARPEHTALLREVADNWLSERNRWAFTQVVREFDGSELRQERRERYDPSRGYKNRWQLISINGRPPTEKEASEWQERKNKKKRKQKPGLAENFDFDTAKVVKETPQSIVYELPLRSNVEWLFPISKVKFLVTINTAGPAPALEQVQAEIDEPFRVALGIARILDIDLDVSMEPPPTADPAEAKPSGTAQAVVSKFGNRVEYYWSEFERVDEPPEW